MKLLARILGGVQPAAPAIPVVPELPREAEAELVALATRLADEKKKPDKIEATVARRREQLVRQRAKLLKRTETMRSLNQATIARAREAQRDGLLGKRARIEWMATPALPDTCDSCRALDGKKATLDGTFPGGVQAPPLHDGCRCCIVVDPG